MNDGFLDACQAAQDCVKIIDNDRVGMNIGLVRQHPRRERGVSCILEQHGTPVYERDWENFIPDMRHIPCLLLKKWDGRRGRVKILTLDNALRLLNTGAKKTKQLASTY